jgi:hypothetical protein
MGYHLSDKTTGLSQYQHPDDFEELLLKGTRWTAVENH